MTSTLPTGQSRICSVELIREDHRICLKAMLGESFTGGSIVAALPDSLVAVEATDEASREYTLSTWLSGLASGALYAFRSLQVPRRRVWLYQFTGRLGRGDMGAVATAAALVVARLSEKEAPPVELGDWRVQSEEANLQSGRAGERASSDNSPVLPGAPTEKGNGVSIRTDPSPQSPSSQD